MKTKLYLIVLITLILVFPIITVAVTNAKNNDKEIKIFESESFIDKFDKDIEKIITNKGIYKRVIADDIDEKNIKLLKNKGCLIKHKLRDSASFECPEEIIPKLNVREAKIFHITDLEADQMIKADQVWGEGITGQGVNVVILDTGIDSTHIELSDSILGCENFVTGENCEDLNGHGTHVAGIITANGIYQVDSNYATGVSPGAGIYMLKVCDSLGYCYEDDMTAAMEYAINNLTNTKIMSISIGGGNFNSHCDSDSLAAKVNWLTDNGFTVVVSAGNEGKGVSSPACASKAIAVGAVDKNGVVPWWSNRGTALDIIAPGVDILSTYSCLAAGDCNYYWYAWMSGTSMSAPHVAGVIALLLQTKPAATTDEIKNALYNTATPATKCYKCTKWSWSGKCRSQSEVTCTSEIQGAGIVNAYEAYLSIKPTICEPTPEICDGIDNDCDNLVDEDLIRQCGMADIGACSFGTETCSAGEWIGCDAVFPIAETCNNIDDNCNGIIDEDLTETFGTNIGECSEGVKVCEAGVWIITVPEIGPTKEICDNLDNDCDGLIDEDGVCGVVKCWSAEYDYLKRSSSQFRKFCKCAEGNYGYNSYSYTRGRKTAYQYIDTEDNENWETTSTSFYYPAYRVKCTDGNWYYTNQDYFFS